MSRKYRPAQCSECEFERGKICVGAGGVRSYEKAKFKGESSRPCKDFKLREEVTR